MRIIINLAYVAHALMKEWMNQGRNVQTSIAPLFLAQPSWRALALPLSSESMVLWISAFIHISPVTFRVDSQGSGWRLSMDDTQHPSKEINKQRVDGWGRNWQLPALQLPKNLGSGSLTSDLFYNMDQQGAVGPLGWADHNYVDIDVAPTNYRMEG